jgi:hypothetical protein
MEKIERKTWSNIFWNSFKGGSMNEKEFDCLMRMNKTVDVTKEVNAHLSNNPEYDPLALITKLRQLMQTRKIRNEIVYRKEFNKRFKSQFHGGEWGISPNSTNPRCRVCEGFIKPISRSQYVEQKEGVCSHCLKTYVGHKIDEKVDEKVNEILLEIRKNAERDLVHIATSSDLPISEEGEKTTQKKRKAGK